MAVVFRLEELERAWERVEDNGGCAGVDGVTVEDFARRAGKALDELLEELAEDAYRPLPLLKILVEKAPGSEKTRRLLVPAVRDRVLQTAAARQLSRSFEEEFLESSFAYRPGRSVDRAVARVIQLRDRGFLYVVV
jgi:retron-type reverse transcriptase